VVASNCALIGTSVDCTKGEQNSDETPVPVGFLMIVVADQFQGKERNPRAASNYHLQLRGKLSLSSFISAESLKS
jgi:hypothetical protein